MQKAQLLESAKQKLVIRNYSNQTIASYLSAINHFANWLITEKVTKLSDEIVEKYLYDLKNNKKRSISSMKQTVAALKFIFSDVLNKDIPSLLIIDVMMFNSPEEIRLMLNNYELI